MTNENEKVEQALSALKSRFLYGKQKSLFPQEIKKLTDNILAAHKRDLAAKDEEIERLKRENFDLNGCILAEQELAEKRNTLIKELADAFEGDALWSEEIALITKAREVVK